MSKRYTDGYFALVLVIAIGLFSIGSVSITFAYSRGYLRADKEHVVYYSRRETAEIAYRECLSSAADLNDARACIENAEITSREVERSEQDLNAQREMAQWARGMLWAAWIVGIATLVATIIGIRYVYLTLVATRAMAADAKSIGESSLVAANFSAETARKANEVANQQRLDGFRTWLFVEASGPFISSSDQELLDQSDFTNLPDRMPNISLCGLIKVTNIGDRPAIIVDYMISIDGIGTHTSMLLPTNLQIPLRPSEYVFLSTGRGSYSKDYRNFSYEGGVEGIYAVTLKQEQLRGGDRDIRTNSPHVIGWVKYRDTIGTVRTQHFRFDPSYCLSPGTNFAPVLEGTYEED